MLPDYGADGDEDDEEDDDNADGDVADDDDGNDGGGCGVGGDDLVLFPCLAVSGGCSVLLSLARVPAGTMYSTPILFSAIQALTTLLRYFENLVGFCR